MKLHKIPNLIERAAVAAKDSPDAETKVGYVLVHGESGAVIAEGYNGFVRGAPDEALPKTRPAKYPFMVHAETNLIANCAKHGISTDGCFLVGTLSPCVGCLRLVFQAGIKTIFFREKYRDFGQNCSMEDLEVNLTQHDGFYRIDLKPKI